MYEVKSPFFPKPGEAFERRVGQVVMLVQVQMPTEGCEDTGEVGEHHQWTQIDVDKSCEGNDGNALVIEGVRLAVLELLGLQFVLVLQAVMPDRMRSEHRFDALFVAVVPVQNRLYDGHQVVGSDGNAEEYQDVHLDLQNVFGGLEVPPVGRLHPDGWLIVGGELADAQHRNVPVDRTGSNGQKKTLPDAGRVL